MQDALLLPELPPEARAAVSVVSRLGAMVIARKATSGKGFQSYVIPASAGGPVSPSAIRRQGKLFELDRIGILAGKNYA